jgi:thiol peroxidase
VLNIFPSVDTPTCAMSVRQFNAKAASAKDTVVLCISFDLPFAQKRFCGAEGITNVEMLSLMRGRNFAKDYGLLIETGPLAGVTARVVIVLDSDNKILHTELVKEIGDEPDYAAALKALT